MITFLVGFMGVGKSYWGRTIAETYCYFWYDLDHTIEKEYGCSIYELFQQKGEEAFRKLEREQLASLVQKTEPLEQVVITTGGGTPCFMNNMTYMKERGRVIWLQSPEDVIYKRIVREKMSRPLISSLSDQALKIFITQKLQEREYFYGQAHHTFDTEELEVSDLGRILTDEL